MTRLFLIFILIFSVICKSSLAATHYVHKHEDLFGESEIQLGLKAGFQVTKYTLAEQTSQGVPVKVNIPPLLRGVGGAAVKFIYPIPKVELDILWNARGWPTTDDTLYSISTPVLIKLPWEFMSPVELEVGVGYQPDFALSGPEPRRKIYSGLLAAAGFSIDFNPYIFDLEVRYNYGLNRISDSFGDARPRDIQVFGGLLWHF